MQKQSPADEGDVLNELINGLREGRPDARREVLEFCRAFLSRRARQDLPRRLQAKVAPSDVVQETLMDVADDLDRFIDRDCDELLVWMRIVLRNNILDAQRRYEAAAKRDLRREIRLDETAAEGPGVELRAEGRSPRTDIEHREEIEWLLGAIAGLPDHYQQVLHMRYRDQKTFAEIGEAMGRTAEAVRKLWFRAVQALQSRIDG